MTVIRLQCPSDPPRPPPVDRRPRLSRGSDSREPGRAHGAASVAHNGLTQHSSIIHEGLGYLGREGEFKHWPSGICCSLAAPFPPQAFAPVTLTPPGENENSNQSLLNNLHLPHRETWSKQTGAHAPRQPEGGKCYVCSVCI